MKGRTSLAVVMPAVSWTTTVHNMNDPALNGIPEGSQAIYLDMLLSEYYGKMVRQGNSFEIVGIQANLQPDPASAGIDVGLSADVSVSYVPTTRHSKFAWNQVYKGWRQQKKLATAIGQQVRYDDFEFGWNTQEGGGTSGGSLGTRARTSTIHGQGLGDLNEELPEKLVLTGASDMSSLLSVGNYSLQDYYNSAYETPAPSRDPFTNAEIKSAKWGDTPFPAVNSMHCTATSTAQWFRDSITGLDIHQGAITTGDVQTFPTSCHSLCGVLFAEAYIMPDDTLGQFEDDFFLTITIFVKTWKSLIHHRTGRKYAKRSRRASRGRSKRTYRKYRRRR